MILSDIIICPKCGGELKFFDKVRRMIRTRGHVPHYIEIRRFKCQKCNSVHREIPSIIFPFKHYEAEIIIGVLKGIITSDTFEYEDYPCERTMTRWILQKDKILREKNISSNEK